MTATPSASPDTINDLRNNVWMSFLRNTLCGHRARQDDHSSAGHETTVRADALESRSQVRRENFTER